MFVIFLDNGKFVNSFVIDCVRCNSLLIMQSQKFVHHHFEKWINNFYSFGICFHYLLEYYKICYLSVKY